MTLKVTPTDSPCGAVVTGIDIARSLTADLVAELRAHWLEHKVLVFPDQKMSNTDLERFSRYFGEPGEDPFFGHIDGHEHICAIQRLADETAPVFAEIFHSDWSFMDVPPAGTVLYGITIPPVGGDTLFADQVAAYEQLPEQLRERVEGLTAIHSAELGYAPDGVYGFSEENKTRSMKILPSEKAREKRQHPLVITHRETGKKALFSSLAYIQGFVGMNREEAGELLVELYAHQSRDEFVYRHKWQQDMLVMWDNRSLLHSATGGYDGYDRLLHRMTIADTHGR
ncbi:TauD/TfdA family dioxygenase [Seongchinamella unica]|uniref:TauD/TfdA family dioxygenase n=1 Tax=Seongchinamella unica TaxID=2547392 RepID=A0A4R5LNH9_9GAMM|nr:TauD/TfdA family dioxygenase [Seongchinamella unica]TDG11856.1 TauD/TfdA family dioxygenase [Seongchinamella unica]